jgi:serine/threonine protein phosphatase PrpC
MILTYGFSDTGSSHIKKDTVCQDSNKILCLDNGMVIAAIADGVGSCKYSDEASRIAVNVSVTVCAEEIATSGAAELTAVIEKAFNKAEREIDEFSLSKGHLLTEYDTTLSLVIYDGKHITYGHCGDGGIIGLTNGGDYIKITEPQKVEEVYVLPLRDKSRWVFGSHEAEFASILLATDGVYDTFFPYLLKRQPVEVYVPLIRYFMDNNQIRASKKNIEAIGKKRQDFINSKACSAITDDKTLVVLINEEVMPMLKDDAYYDEPDWDALQEEWNKKAYPHLYKDEEPAPENENSD